MHLLFLTPQLPYPPRQGTTIRNYGLIAYLARRHTVDLLSFLAPGETLDAENPLTHLCRRVGTVPQPMRSLRERARTTLLSPLPDMALRLEHPAMHRLLGDWLKDTAYAVVQVEGIEMAQYAPAGPGPAVVFDDHNCEYLLQQRNALTDLRSPRRWHAAAYSLVQWRKLRRYEAAVCCRADAVLAVSEPDRAALLRLADGLRVEVVPNGVDLAGYPVRPPAPLPPGPATLLFTGKMDYRPNIDAVLWFAQRVLPLVLARRPDVRFQIVGANPHPRLDVLRGHPQIEITGAVPDVRPYLDAAAVYVIPMRVGGGTRFKALEAMAAAKPIVSTRLGVEGIPVEPGRELLLADTPADFAAALSTLLFDLESRAEIAALLGAAARRLVAARYTWDHLLPDLEQLYLELHAQRFHASPTPGVQP